MRTYSVRQVATITGVPASTLRTWERRYGVVEPDRTESRYRLYDDRDLARLQRMADLVAQGAPASIAAQQVASERLGVGSDALDAPGDPVVDTAGAGRDVSSDPDVGRGLVRAAQTLDSEFLDRLLDDLFAKGRFEHVVETQLFPALHHLGTAWAVGGIDVAGEHFVSAAILRRLGQRFEAAGARRGAPVVLVGLPAGAEHQLGAAAFATSLRRRGLDVRYLGPDVPRESWLHASRVAQPRAVVLTVPTPQDAAAASEVVDVLAGEPGHLLVFVGGRGAGSHHNDKAVLLPASLSEATEKVWTALRNA